MTSMQHGYIKAHIDSAIRGVQEADDDNILVVGILQKLEDAKKMLGASPAANGTTH